MGYCVTQESCHNFLLKKENMAAALRAVKRLAGKETISDGSGNHFSWVDNEYINADNLVDALEYWRWHLEVDSEGDGITLIFDGEKLGDDNILLSALAPHVEHGEIEMVGEDYARWKWVFKDGVLRELTGRVVYDD